MWCLDSDSSSTCVNAALQGQPRVFAGPNNSFKHGGPVANVVPDPRLMRQPSVCCLWVGCGRCSRHQQQPPDPVPVGTLCSFRLLFGCATHPLPLGRSHRRLPHHCMQGPDKLAVFSILPCVGSGMTFCSTCDCWEPMHAPTCWIVLCTACVGIQQQKRACPTRWPQSHCRCRYLFTRLLLSQERDAEAAAH